MATQSKASNSSERKSRAAAKELRLNIKQDRKLSDSSGVTLPSAKCFSTIDLSSTFLISVLPTRKTPCEAPRKSNSTPRVEKTGLNPKSFSGSYDRTQPKVLKRNLTVVGVVRVVGVVAVAVVAAVAAGVELVLVVVVVAEVVVVVAAVAVLVAAGVVVVVAVVAVVAAVGVVVVE